MQRSHPASESRQLPSCLGVWQQGERAVDEITSQLAVAALVLSAILVGPGLAVAFLLVRRKVIKATRRSPIGISLLRGPGHTLREQLDEETSNIIWDLLILSVFPLMMLALYLAQARFLGLDRLRGVEYVYLVAVVATIAYLVRRIVMRGARLSNLKAGYDAELAVGQELDALMRRGAIVFHDFPAEGFNIDHVVITRNCVYVVETKGYTKLTRLKGREAATVEFDGLRLKFPTWTTDEPILQAERQAKWFADWIKRASGHPIPVRPVVALPGWFVQE
jgi:hypothetical protein